MIAVPGLYPDNFLSGRFDGDLRMFCHGELDRLHDLIPVIPMAADFMRTPAIRRLHGVSHLGLHPGMIRANVSSSRWEHTLGVYFLGLIATNHPSLNLFRPLVVSAAFGHDAGSPFATHNAMPAMRKVFGSRIAHETTMFLVGDDFFRVVNEYGLRAQDVIGVIEGGRDMPAEWREYLGAIVSLINGPFDLDTVDNTYRFQLHRQRIGDQPFYQPIELAWMYRRAVNGGIIQEPGGEPVDYPALKGYSGLVLQGEEDKLLGQLHGWESCRGHSYDFIYGKDFSSAVGMLQRALHLAGVRGELEEEFFRLTDEKACDYLLQRNEGTQRLVEDLFTHWYHIPLYRVEWKEEHLTDKVRSLLRDPEQQQSLADDLAQHLRTTPWHVSIWGGRKTAAKNITLPLITPDGQPVGWKGSLENTYYLNIAAAPGYRARPIGEYMEELFGIDENLNEELYPRLLITS